MSDARTIFESDGPEHANDRPCARGGPGWCGKPPRDVAHTCLTPYGCDGNHRRDPECHIYVCPLHGNNGITDVYCDYWYCGPCRIAALKDAIRAERKGVFAALDEWRIETLSAHGMLPK